MYCIINLLFFDTPLLCYYTNLNSSIICFLFFWILASSFCVCVCAQSAPLTESFLKYLLFYQLFYFKLKHQLLLLFLDFLTLKQFLLHLLQIFQHYEKVFVYTYSLTFYTCFWQKTKIHILLHIFCPQVQLNISIL